MNNEDHLAILEAFDKLKGSRRYKNQLLHMAQWAAGDPEEPGEGEPEDEGFFQVLAHLVFDLDDNGRRQMLEEFQSE